MSILVSIIIPVYNCERYIYDCISSVVNQTYPRLEIIIINDGSTDKSGEIIKCWAERDSRIVIINQVNSGRPSIVRNVGIRKAKGECFCFLDGDDLYHPDKIRRSIEVLVQYRNIKMVFHDIICIANDGSPYDNTYLHNAGFHQLAASYMKNDHENVFLCNSNFYNLMSSYISSIHTSSILLRREIIEEESEWFPEDSLIGEDIDLWFRLAKKHRLAFIDSTLSYYRQHEGSLTKRSIDFLRGSIEVHSKNFSRAMEVLSFIERKVYSKRISQLHYHLGYHYFLQFKYDKARFELLNSLRWDFNTNTLLLLLKTMLPKIIATFYRQHKET